MQSTTQRKTGDILLFTVRRLVAVCTSTELKGSTSTSLPSTEINPFLPNLSEITKRNYFEILGQGASAKSTLVPLLALVNPKRILSHTVPFWIHAFCETYNILPQPLISPSVLGTSPRTAHKRVDFPESTTPHIATISTYKSSMFLRRNPDLIDTLICWPELFLPSRCWVGKALPVWNATSSRSPTRGELGNTSLK